MKVTTSLKEVTASNSKRRRQVMIKKRKWATIKKENKQWLKKWVNYH